MTIFDGPDQIRQIIFGFHKSRVLLTAFELELFDHLHGTALSSEELASHLGTDIRATDRLLCVLHNMGFVAKNDELYANTDAANRYFVKKSADYMHGITHLYRRWDNWSDLTDAVRRGSLAERQDLGTWDENDTRSLLAMLHQRGPALASALIRKLDLSDVRTVLDIGGGSGVFSLALTQAREGIQATIFELPNVVAITNDYIQSHDDRHAITVRAGDFLTEDLGTGYDLVLVASIIHMFDAPTNAALIRKCAAALRARGQLVIMDYIMQDDRLKPEVGAGFALHMLVSTPHGDTYTARDIDIWLDEAGFEPPVVHDTPMGSSILITRKAVR